MKKLLGMTLVVVSLSSLALASVTIVPEIDGSSAISALTLIAGAAMVIRGRRN